MQLTETAQNISDVFEHYLETEELVARKDFEDSKIVIEKVGYNELLKELHEVLPSPPRRGKSDDVVV